MKKVSLIIVLIVSLSCIAFSQTVTIGKQVWATKNLDVSRFRNGDSIPQAKSDDEWEKASVNRKPAWCYYANDTNNSQKFGKLYNWYAVNDPRGLAPKGWHIPSDEEWTILTDFLGGESIAGTKIKSTNGWSDNKNGTNESGFLGLPGGLRDYYGSFSYIGKFGIWWSSSEVDSSSIWLRSLDYYSAGVSRYDSNRGTGLSVRCLRD